VEVVFVAEVVVSLNQQQLELVDKTVVRLGVGSREELLRLALREFFSDNLAGLKEGQ
jgi:metal-responsive CopG/Arc/MetJ family transcriptional regulator